MAVVIVPMMITTICVFGQNEYDENSSNIRQYDDSTFSFIIKLISQFVQRWFGIVLLFEEESEDDHSASGIVTMIVVTTLLVLIVTSSVIVGTKLYQTKRQNENLSYELQSAQAKLRYLQEKLHHDDVTVDGTEDPTDS
jgi:hypothetical protein